MTFREKIAKEHPERIVPGSASGVFGCPYHYKLEPEDKKPCEDLCCDECWNREMPETESTSTASSTQQLDIHKLIDDAIAKQDRRVTVFISNVGTSINMYPLDNNEDKWIPIKAYLSQKLSGVTVGYRCPECTRESSRPYPYCPECGTQLKGVKDK